MTSKNSWRKTRFSTLLFSLTLLGLGLGSAPSSAAKKPNIVFILVDDLGWSDIGCYGNSFNETPRIDRLAREGMRFTDFYAAGAVCSPTRASIFSGQYPGRVGITDFIAGHWRPFEKLVVPQNDSHLPLELTTPAEALRAAGYATAYYGKWHLGGGEKFHPTQHGFDEAIVTRGRHFAPRFRTDPPVAVKDGTYLGDFLTDRAVDFIRRGRERPFFVVVSHYAVHIPLEAKRATVDKYAAKPKPAHGVNHPVYAAMLEHVDDSVARILAALDEKELSDNTLVVFTSDNGGLRKIYTGIGETVTTNAPLRDEKGSLYEGGIRVPLIVRWPGVVRPGTTCSEPAVTVDFLPTFVAVAGAPKVSGQAVDGRSLVPLFKDPDAAFGREAIFFHYPHYHHSRPAGVIRAGEWKLLEFFEDGALELYNVARDLGEEQNLAAKYPERAAALRDKLAAWRTAVGARSPEKNPRYDPARAREWWSRRTKKPLDIEALRRRYEGTRRARK